MLEMVRASRPEALSVSRFQHLKSHEEGHRAGTVSFQDIVARSPAPKVDNNLTVAREALEGRVVDTGVEMPDMCPGGSCQMEVTIGSKTTVVAVDQSENVMRLSSLTSFEGVDPPEYHPQLFIDNSPETPAWGYIYYPHPNCKDENLLFRGTLETPESDDSILSVETVAGESGTIVETTKETTASTVITENIDGTQAQLEVLGSTPWKAEIQRTSLKSGCESTGCDTYFGLPKGTTVIDTSPQDWKMLMQRGTIPAGYCTPSSELVQVTAGEEVDRSAFWWFFKPAVVVHKVVSSGKKAVKAVAKAAKPVVKAVTKAVTPVVKEVERTVEFIACFFWCAR